MRQLNLCNCSSVSCTGNHSYQAPEEARKEVDDAKKADLFRLGAILYFLHENRMPFNGHQLTLTDESQIEFPQFERFEIDGDFNRKVTIYIYRLSEKLYKLKRPF